MAEALREAVVQFPMIIAPGVGSAGIILLASVGVGRSSLEERKLDAASYVSVAEHDRVVVSVTVVMVRVVVVVWKAA